LGIRGAVGVGGAESLAAHQLLNDG
jgi:hypothetical protein